MRDRLLPLAVSETEFESWRNARQARRRTELPTPTFVDLDGIASGDAKRLNALLARHVGAPLDVNALEQDIAMVTGLDRYQTVTWRFDERRLARVWLARRGRIKPYAPPFMMLGVNLENTTSSDFRITATGRYLAFDVVGSGLELRVDGTLGSDRRIAIELYRPLGPTPLFFAPYAGVGNETFNQIDDDAVIARYKKRSGGLGSMAASIWARAATCASACTLADRPRRSRSAILVSLNCTEMKPAPNRAGDSIRRIARSCLRADGSRRCSSRVSSTVPT